MASADSCTFNRTFQFWLPSSEGVPYRPPRIRVDTFHSCTCPIYLHSPWRLGTSSCFADSSDCDGLRLGSCPSGRVFASSFLQIPSHGRHPFLQLTAGGRQPPFGTFTYRLHPCRAHEKRPSPPESGKALLECSPRKKRRGVTGSQQRPSSRSFSLIIAFTSPPMINI